MRRKARRSFKVIRRLETLPRVGGGSLVADRLIRAVVDPLAQVLARLEVRNVLAGERNGLAGLRIATLAGRPEVQREAAEAANLDALAGRQRVAHDLQELLDGQLDVLRR